MITPEELAEVARLDREATPGPWTDARYSSEDEHGPHIEDRFESTVAVCSVSVDEHSANGTFIARARTLLPRLAAAHEELLAKHGALFDAASKLTIAVRSGRGVTEALAALELVLDPEGEEVTGG